LTAKKNNGNSVDIKTSTTNLALNIVIFLLVTVIIYLAISVFGKLGDTENTKPVQNKKGKISEIIQADVMNGCGTKGVAERFTDFLRTRNVDVVNTGNYISFDIDKTIVVDRSGNIANAHHIAEMLGVNKRNVIQQLNDDYFLDVTIIIGQDYFSLNPLK